MPSVNEQILHVWDIGTTGLVANISTTLLRYDSPTTSTVASESVTVQEIGTTGAYSFTYTPLLAATYDLSANESSTLLSTAWQDIVADAPSAAQAANSYCTEADVVSLAQMGDYTTTTVPTEAEVLLFMENRAAEVYGRLAQVMGAEAPGPAGYDTTIDTSVDKGRALSRSARLANMLGAAMDAVEASGAGESPSRSERVAELNALYNAALTELMATAKSYQGYDAYARTHYDEGRVSKGTFTSETEPGMTFDETTKW